MLAIAVMGFIIFVPVLIIAPSTSNEIHAEGKLSSSVMGYEEMVKEISKKHDMEEYVYLIMCVMQVESGGEGLDPMQSSEGAFNKKYPQRPNGITDPVYSIECGIQELKSALKRAEVTDPKDTEKIKLALAGYNFGPGYIDWCQIHYEGKWSLENANEFSDIMKQKMGWDVYGDPNYVNKVMSIYMLTGDNGTDTPSMDIGKYEKLIYEAEKYIGYPYVFGGSTPSTSFDCSGYICWVYTHSGIYNLPRTTAQGIYNQCIAIDKKDAKPGDLIFFTNTYDCGEPVSHIGIYVGNGRMLHCGDPIGYETIGDYWSSHFYGFGRLNIK